MRGFLSPKLGMVISAAPATGANNPGLGGSFLVPGFVVERVFHVSLLTVLRGQGNEVPDRRHRGGKQDGGFRTVPHGDQDLGVG